MNWKTEGPQFTLTTIKMCKGKSHAYMYVHENSNAQCQKKESANPGQLFQAFGPHQQGAAQSLPGTAGLK